MAKLRVSYEYSEAEDKSIRLGLFLIACGILSLFILGFCWLSPTLQSLQSKPANCTVSPAEPLRTDRSAPEAPLALLVENLSVAGKNAQEVRSCCRGINPEFREMIL